jgi:hypothetical protein
MRADSSDRSTMIGVFSQRFPDLSRRELGKLFDKYRPTGRIGIRWDGRSGQGTPRAVSGLSYERQTREGILARCVSVLFSSC